MLTGSVMEWLQTYGHIARAPGVPLPMIAWGAVGKLLSASVYSCAK